MSPADINHSRPQFSVPEHVIARIEAVLKQFAEFLYAQQLSKKSVTNYLSDVRVFLEHRLANDQVFQERAAQQDLKQWLSSLEQDIVAYKAELLEQATPLSTINRYMASFRQFGAFLTAVHQISTFGHSSGGYLKNVSFSPESRLHPLSDRLLQQFKLALIHRDCSESTIKNYLADAHQYMQWLGEKPVFPDQIKRGVAEYLGFLRKKGASRATKARALTSLKQFYRWANESQYIKKNPFASKVAEVGTFVKTAFTPLAFFERFRRTVQQKTQEKPSEESEGKREARPTHFLAQAYDRYTRWPVSSYLHLAILILFVTLLGVFGYQQLFLNAEKKLAFPTALVRPNRILSFQGRLTDSTGQTPITTATNFTFKLFDALADGNQLWNSGICGITPDQDGVFSTLLGSSCGAEIDSGVFSENPNVYLEVTVAAETLTPRQQIATVGYALNAETLQGYPSSASAVENTGLIMNNSGQVLLGNASPVLRSTSGTFTVQGNALTLSTNTGTGGNISIAPDGVGQRNLLGGTTTQDFINVTNANLTTGKLINGTVGNNNTEYKFLSFTGGSTPSEKFYVGALGNVYAGNSLFAPVATISATNTGATPLIVNGTGGQIFSIANNGNIAATGTLTGLTGLTSSGTITFSGLNTAGAVVYTDSSGVLGDTAQGVSGYVLTSGGTGTPTWQDPATLTGANYWQLNRQVLAPGNTTLDLAVGGNSTAAALFRVSGTPTTSGNGAVLSSTTLTTGNLLSLSSTATSLTSGKLLSLDWSPGSAITATGDLFNINIGSNGTVGNLLNITDNTSSLFSVSETAVTSNLPTSFTSSGDVSIAYDLLFTNPTASYIKSSAPLYVQAGEMFNSSDLTLRTFNKGNVIADTEALVANYAATVASQLVVGTTTAPSGISGLYLTNSTTYGKALAILNQTESQDIFTASASSTPKFTIANNGNITATGTITGLTGITSSGTITFSGLNTAGAVVYTNVSGTLGVTAQGVSTYLLTSAGAGTPTWTDPATVGTNYWQLDNLVLSPGNSSLDVAVGGSATSSAKFQVFGVSGNATTTGTLTFNGAALANNVIAARRNVGLQIGGGTETGDILLDSNTFLRLNTINNQAITTGTGQITLAGNVDATNGLDVTTANLTVGGANFSVAPATGNIITAGDLALNGGDLTSIATTFNFDIGNTGVLNFRDGTNTLFAINDYGTQGYATSSGDLGLGGQFQLGRFFTNPTTIGKGSLVYNTATDSVYYSDGTTWNQFASYAVANTWTDGGTYLYPTNRESARIYDAGGTDYIDIAHDGTNVVITTANTTKITIDAAVDLASTLNVGGNTITSPGDLSLNSSGDKVIVSPDLQINGGDIFGSSGETRITLVDALNLTNFSGSVDINGSYAGNDGFLTANRTATISSLIATDTPLTLRDNNAMNLLTVANSGLITVRTATISSQAVNSLDTVAFTLNAANSLTTQGAKLLSVQNATIEKFYVDKDGNIYAAGTILAGNGMGMLMQNKSGGTVAQKAIVIVDISNNSAFTTTTTPYSKGMYGVITGVGLGTTNDANSDGNCDANDYCMVTVGGEVNVTIKNTTTVAKGDYVYTSDTAGSAVTSAKLFDGMLGVFTNTSTSGSGYVKFIFKPQTQVTAAASIDKGSKYNEYRLYANNYTGVGEGINPNDNFPLKGMYFDNLLDPTKTDSANTTLTGPTQISAVSGTPPPAAPFRAGLMGGQTMSAATTDNAGNTYLGSTTVNKTAYYDRTRDSSRATLINLGIDPNWYNGVTLAVATTSAAFSQNDTNYSQTINPNLSTTYNGSLLQVTGTYARNAKTIYITIKSPTTFDWTDYYGQAVTGVTMTPGTAQTLGTTGVSVKFSDVNYNVGDVFRIASWFVEPSGTTRGAKAQFPERTLLVASSTNVDIIDADTQKLWMRFTAGTYPNYYLSSGVTNHNSVTGLNGRVYVAGTGALYSIAFTLDTEFLSQNGFSYAAYGAMASRNGSANLQQATTAIYYPFVVSSTTVADVAATVIPNTPTQTITVNGWGYFNL